MLPTGTVITALHFTPATSFAAKPHRDLTARGFEVWFDRMAMPSRGLRIHQEIQDAVAARERLVLVIGPKAALSDCGDGVGKPAPSAVRAPGRQAVTPILRQGDYLFAPDEMKLLHCEDFRDDVGLRSIWKTSSGQGLARAGCPLLVRCGAPVSHSLPEAPLRPGGATP